MANAFDVATRTIFRDQNGATSAVYQAGGCGPEQPVRVVMRAPDERTTWNDVAIVRETLIIEVQSADVAAPAAGDGFTINDVCYVVQGVPERDSLQLAWTIELIPTP